MSPVIWNPHSTPLSGSDTRVCSSHAMRPKSDCCAGWLGVRWRFIDVRSFLGFGFCFARPQRHEHRFALCGRDRCPAARDEQEIFIERNGAPELVPHRHHHADGCRRAHRLGQPAPPHLAQLLQRTPVKQLPDAPQRHPLRLQQPDRDELQQMLFPIPAALRGIHQPECPVVADVALRNALTGLSADRRNVVFLAPRVHLVGQHFEGKGLTHEADTVRQCYCQLFDGDARGRCCACPAA